MNSLDPISVMFVRQEFFVLSPPDREGKWLAQQVDPRIKSTVVDYRIPCVARREQHLDHWMQPSSPICDVTSVKAIREHDVGEEKIDGAR